MSHKVSMNIPKELLEMAVKASGAKNKTEAVIIGLKDLIRKKKITDLIKLKGSGVLNLSQKQLQSMRKR